MRIKTCRQSILVALVFVMMLHRPGVGAVWGAEPNVAPTSAQVASLPAGLPPDFEKRIPIPPGATVAQVSGSQGVIHEVELAVPQDYQSLVDFYTNGLKKAGFNLGMPLKMAARKAFNLPFYGVNGQNSLSIFPDPKSPGKLVVRIVYQAAAATTEKAKTAGQSAQGGTKSTAGMMPY